MSLPAPVKKFLDQYDLLADELLRKGKHILPHVARFCLVMTFIEDSLRMWFQWKEQVDYMAETWNCGWVVSFVLIGYNLVAQAIGSVMVLLRLRPNIACYLLTACVILQTVIYQIYTEWVFLGRNFALLGGVLMLYVESHPEAKSTFADLPTSGENKTRSYQQLAGRILIVLMYLTLIRFDTIYMIIGNLIGTALVIMVAAGFKTKVAALVLTSYLFLINLLHNPFWLMDRNRPGYDYLKYDFFQTMSVIGGLLLVVALGPGGVAVDELKKRW